MSGARMRRGGLWAAGGSVVAAAVASACCWLPLLLVLVGASAAGVSAVFEPARPWFLGASVVLLGVGFYLSYFRRPDCDDGQACAEPNRKLQRTNRVVLWAAVVGVLTFALFPEYIGAIAGNEPKAATPLQVRLVVEGMTCDGCAVTVEHALLKVPGVVSAKVSYESETAVVTLDPSSPASLNNLVSAVGWAGYSASLSRESRSD